MHLSEIWVYPVKSCRGIRLASARVVETGLEHDRTWMVVDERGRFVTQREHAVMARIETALQDDGLELRFEHRDPLLLHPNPGPLRPVRIWQHDCEAHDAGDEAAHWLSEVIGLPVRLVRMPDDHYRQVGSAYEGKAATAFSDGYPILVLSEASLADLNARLDEPVPMNRFRPNLVIAGAEPFAEDGWGPVRIGGVELVGCKPCERCVVPTIDQQTSARGKEPLRTLSTYRKDERGVLFGQNLVHLGRGAIAEGDLVVPR